MADKELNLILRLKDEVSSELSKIDSKFNIFGKDATSASQGVAIALGAVTVAAAAAAFAFGVSAVKAAAEAQVQMAKFNATMDTIATTTPEVKQRLIEASDAVLNLGYDNEDAAVSLAKFYQRTGDVQKAVELNNVAMDLARAKNIDLSSATQLVNLALSGSGKALMQYGIVIKDSATPLEALGILHDKVRGQAEAFAKTYEGKMQILNQKVNEFKESVGTKLLPVLTQALDAVIKLADKYGDLGKDIQTVTDFLKEHQTAIILASGAILGALTPALASMAVALFGVAVAGATAMIALWPFVLGGLLIAGIVAGVIWIVQNWTMLSQKAVEIFGVIGTFLSGIWQGILTAIQFVWGLIMAYFQWYWDTVTGIFSFGVALAVGAVMMVFDAFGIDIVAVFQGILLFLQTGWNTIVMVFQMAIGFIQSIWNTMWTAIKNFITPIWLAIKSVISLAFNDIIIMFNAIAKPIADVWGAIWNAVGNALTAAMEGVKSVVKGTLNWIIEKINWVIDQLNQIAQKGASALHISVPTMANIPYLAQGGIVRSPTLAMIGEAGPEAVIPLNKAGGMGMNINITINGDVSGEELVSKVTESIMQSLRFNTKFAV